MNFSRLGEDCKKNHSRVWRISTFSNNNIHQEKGCRSAASDGYTSSTWQLCQAEALLWKILCVLSKHLLAHNMSAILPRFQIFIGKAHFCLWKLFSSHNLWFRRGERLVYYKIIIKPTHIPTSSCFLIQFLCISLLKHNRKGSFGWGLAFYNATLKQHLEIGL